MTPTQMLLEDRLGCSLGSYLVLCKAFGLSVRTIAEVMEEKTGVKVSKSSVAKWLADVTPSK